MRVILAGLIAVLICGAASANSRDPIRVVEGVTPAQQVVSALVVRALKKSGFKFELVGVPEAGLLEGLATGKVHAHPAAIVAAHVA